MFRFAIDFMDLQKQWVLCDKKWVSGRSWIEPYQHEAITTIVLRQGFLYNFSILQAVDPGKRIKELFKDDSQDCQQVLKEWPYDWNQINISKENNTVSVSAGSFGVAPVYFVQGGCIFRGSWNPRELYGYLPSQPIDLDRAALYLSTFAQPYSKNTILAKLARLTERSSAIWGQTPGGKSFLRYIYPNSQKQPTPRSIMKGADPSVAFEKILSQALFDWCSNNKLTKCSHLSGGYDSGIVAIVANNLLKCDLFTYGLLMPNINGKHQLHRRNEYVQKCGFSDTVFFAIDYPPFAQNQKRPHDLSLIPWGECYEEAFQFIIREVGVHPNPILMMGTGGDELCYPSWDELDEAAKNERMSDYLPSRSKSPTFLKEEAFEIAEKAFLEVDRAPRSVLSSSALEDSGCHTPACMKNGILPVHPLCDLRLLEFSRSLPIHWREKRNVVRSVLSKAGLGQKILDPVCKEDFSDVMDLGIRKSAGRFLRSLFETSHLASLGLIDKKNLLNSYDRHCNGDTSQKNLSFYAIAILEATYQSCRKDSSNDPLSLLCPRPELGD
jgi:asparagine synthase (glutamine-hydrolysing)